MEDTRTETASDVINDLISELAVSQNILDVIFVEKHFFEDNHSIADKESAKFEPSHRDHRAVGAA